MRKFLFIALFGFVSVCTFSTPFGLSMGMTLDEVLSCCEDITYGTYKKNPSEEEAYRFLMALLSAKLNTNYETLEEVVPLEKEEPKHIKYEMLEEGIYFVQPKNAHPLFKTYIVYVDETEGLYEIRAVSEPIETNKYGDEIKSSFFDIKNRVAKTYGEPIIVDEIDEARADSFDKAEDNWFYSLYQESRTLAAIWGEEKSLADNIDYITLYCEVVSGSFSGEAVIVLDYVFTNIEKVEDEQDTVF